MSIEGLRAILEKEEIVATQRAYDLLERPEAVDEAYKRHVRTYVPFGRQAEDRDSRQSVRGFEQQVIREVRQAGALRGYITAEYGHGKTSTALYLWERARSENILAIPPFQLNKLTDLIVATFGWAKYEIGRTRPSAVGEASTLYESIIARSAETVAQKYAIGLAAARRMVQDTPEILEVTPADYIRFFEELTNLATGAGYDGLLIIADEIQQYIEPEIKSGVKDPISPLFDVIGAILTRRHYLCFGLILVIPPKELALMREQRGDLVHRVLQASLDLGTVYDGQFTERLWHRLAQEFDFADHRDRIVTRESLEALGQISARSDLSDGPRTVVNALRRATQRYIELGYPTDDPYTPCHLVDDFVEGRIQYDSPKKIPKVVTRALDHSLVKGHSQRQQAIRWAAAFPNEGVRRDLQIRLGLVDAFDDLAHSALGDLIISVGDVRNPGFTLRGLDQVIVESDWITTTIREFWRTYYETSDKTRQRAVAALRVLLTQRVFPENQWSIVESIPEGLTRDAGILFEGSFNAFSRRFPERRVHVRILWEDEPTRDAGPLGEAVVQFRLRRHLDLAEEQRRFHEEPLSLDYRTHQLDITLNLMHREEGNISPNLERIITPIVSPYKLTPLLLLALHEVLSEKRDQNLIPRKDDQEVTYFQSDVLDCAFRELFNSGVGANIDAGHERIVETGLQQMLEAMYQDYDTLIRVSNWTSSLLKYCNALKHLETSHERQGQIVFEGTKDDIATLFALTNTGLDTFISNFPSLIEVVREFPTKREIAEGKLGAVRFRLHPLEQAIKSWLASSDERDRVRAAGRTFEVHTLPSSVIYQRAEQLGYKEKEIDAALDLMSERGLVERDSRKGVWRESITQAPSLDELLSEINTWQQDIAELLVPFSQSNQLNQWQKEAEKARTFVEQKLREKPDDEQTIRLRRSVQTYRRHLAAFIEERHQTLQQETNRLLSRVPRPDRRQGSGLETALQGSVNYVAQVNDLRTRVLRQFASLNADAVKLERDVQAIEAALHADDLSSKSLARLATSLKLLDGLLVEMQTRRDEFTARYNEFAAWAKLVGDGSALQVDIQMLGEIVREHGQRLDALAQEINAHISSEKLGALPHAPTYSMRLAEIAASVRQVRDEAVQSFAHLQDRYRDMVISTLHFPSDQLWSPLQYNPLAPEDSYARLISEAQNALDKMRERLERTVAKERESITATLSSPHIAVLPPEERANLMEQGSDLRAKYDSVVCELSDLCDQLSDTKTVRDFPTQGEGGFHRIVHALGKVVGLVQEYHPQVDALSSRLRNMELTGPEQLLCSLLTGEASELELGELRQTAQRLSEEEFWNAVRGLHAKRRLRLVAEAIRYD